MNAFSVVSSTLLRRATSSNLVPTTSTPTTTTTTTTTTATPSPPPPIPKDEVEKVKVSKHSNAPHAVLPEYVSETRQSFDGISFPNGCSVDSEAINTNDDNINDRKANINRHSVPIMSVTTTPTATVYESPKARKIVPATVHTTPRSSLPPSPSPSSDFCSSLPPLPMPTIAPARASMDSYLDRARIINPSPADTVLATTMVSHPRRRQMHKKSASTSVLLPLPHSHQSQYTSSPLTSSAIASSFEPHRAFGSYSLPHIPSLSTPQGTSDIETVILGAAPKQPQTLQNNEEVPEDENVDEASSSEDESGEKRARAVAAAAAFAASTVIVKPEPEPVSPALVEAVPPPVEIKAPLPFPVESVPEPKIDIPAPIEVAPFSAPLTLPEEVSSPLESPVSSVTPASTSFLSSWGRSKGMMPHLPRPSPLMSFHAARKVVTSSVKSVGTGLIPSKEQLESIPVAGRILSHPVMDSTLHYIASKTTHRGIPWVDPRKVIKPEDIQYRKLNKKLVQQAMTLSVLAVQKEELSRAIEDEAGDDAFELYLAAITTLMHALPIETCDPLRREAFVSQLRDFVDEHQEMVEHPVNPNIRSKKLRRQGRRRHRHYSNQAMSLIQHHTTMDVSQPQLSRQQQKQQRQQKEQEHRALRQKPQADRKAAAAATVAAAATTAEAPKPPKSKRSSRSRRHSGRRHHHQEIASDDEDLQEISGSVSSIQTPSANANANGLGDTIINTAVHSAIRLKQSPIPDVVGACFRTSKVILSKVDERFHLQEKAWELSKQSIERAIELDEQYAIHEAVTETIFATVTGLVKAGIAYKETPSYRDRKGRVEGPAPVAQVSAPPSPAAAPMATASRSRDPQRAKASGFLSGRRLRRFYQRQESELSEEASDSNSDSEESSSDEYDSDTRFAPSSSSSMSSGSSAASTCFSSDEEEVVMMRSLSGKKPGMVSATTQAVPQTPPPPYSEQVREKIDMFMALKGAATITELATYSLGREQYMRDKVYLIVVEELHVREGDWIVIADVDEVVRPSILQTMKYPDPEASPVDAIFADYSEAEGRSWDLVRFGLCYSQYSFDTYIGIRFMPVGIRYREWESHLARVAPTGRESQEFMDNKYLLEGIGPPKFIDDAGWHYSWCFSNISQFRTKLDRYGHPEYRRLEMQTQQIIVDKVVQGKDIFG
ncbi:hypothetical protein BGZ82_010692 [Podila clonocystis]|nr:hypothetical protein BGZ82_010692 [Podila clonocystis]